MYKLPLNVDLNQVEVLKTLSGANNEAITEHHKEAIRNVVPELIQQVLDENEPYYKSEEPEVFVRWDGSIGEDHSGEAFPLTKEGFKVLLDTIEGTNTGKNRYYAFICEESEVLFLLEELIINRWYPTYQSGCGKHWISYKDLLQDKFNDWKYESIDWIRDEDDCIDFDIEDQDILDIELDYYLEEYLSSLDANILLVHKSLSKFIDKHSLGIRR